MTVWKQCPGCGIWKTNIVYRCGDCRKADDLRKPVPWGQHPPYCDCGDCP